MANERPIFQATFDAIPIITSLLRDDMSLEDIDLAHRLIAETVMTKGLNYTVVGISNVVKLLLLLRREESGYTPEQTLSMLSMSISTTLEEGM